MIACLHCGRLQQAALIASKAYHELLSGHRGQPIGVYSAGKASRSDLAQWTVSVNGLHSGRF
jgi:hypothetical protein